ncbi:Crp/Fnr family transcriptional regulator [Mucilaginibacter daejeonensis]|uniref:Crp/Fnr family transcriptional regulator n=1 Tax=Mucilaginibacter daejeonensis TaxID=398049 RepID=UPI001D174010|nr:Crp/Fnr family transcriptional regulator [Mucilaginibacter daejeonensis]UEG51433.1 Crp/Fnr family transcriptional regulator [Mucilaginibacter daejeonensis]
MQDLKKFLISRVNMTEEDLTTVISYFRPKVLDKGDLLLKRGQIATSYYFLRSGGLRFYYDEDHELTAWIVQPGEFFTEISSLSPERPTRFNIEAVEHAELYYISKKDMELLYKQLPAWQEFGRRTWEGMAIRMIDEIIRFQTMTVEERYLEFLKKPGFMQLISVKQMASYLGITPNALSRIRKNLR